MTTRVLLDTGVFVQAARNPTGEAVAILELLSNDDGFEMVTSPRHLYEIGEVLTRPEAGGVAINPEIAKLIVMRLEATASIEQDLSPRRASYTLDPNDDYLVALAAKTQARLITYDQGVHKHHPAGVEVAQPVEFLRELRERSQQRDDEHNRD